MKKVLKVICTIIVLILLAYVIYRNINLRKIPTEDIIKDESTSSLYHSVLPNTDNNVWTNYFYSNKSVTNESIPEELKYNIAYKNTGTGDNTIKEEIIKKQYEKVFGPNTYKTAQSFIGGCNTYTYNPSLLAYIRGENTTCKNQDIYILSRIVDASIKANTMDITVVIAYINKTTKTVYKNCNEDMSSCSNVLVKNFKEFDEADLDQEKYSLNKYTFTFNMANEEYYFTSSKKIK